jgi:hypothetical protein
MRWSLFVIAHLPKKLEGDDGMRSQNLPKVQVHTLLLPKTFCQGLSPAHVRQQQIDLGIVPEKEKEVDFHLFLHMADSCRPSFYTSVLTRPKAVGKLVLDLFESF